MSDEPCEQIKKFVFNSKKEGGSSETLEILIPEKRIKIYHPKFVISFGVSSESLAQDGGWFQDHFEHTIEKLQASYSFYTWPCAPILAWFLWEHRADLAGKHILELGAGTALPGILAAKCGATVTLTDSAVLPKSLLHIKRCCEVNGLNSNQVRVTGLSWGLFLTSTFALGPVDLIIGSDCFYDPSVFEDIIVTVSYLLDCNPQARFLSVYQERSADWSIEHLLHKWKLRCEHIPLNTLGTESGVDINELMHDHTIHLLEITKN